MKRNLPAILLMVCGLCFGGHAKVKYSHTPRNHSLRAVGGINPYPLLSINGDTTQNQTFITANAATAYITSNGAGVTTFYYPTGGGGGGVGTVTSVSVASANGLAGTVATATTTPAITLSTSVTGVLKGNGTSISAQTTGDLSDGTSDGISVAGGTGAVLGSGTTITQQAASASANGYLTSTNWSNFNGKQAPGSYMTALTGDVTASGPGSSAATISDSTVTGKLLTGFVSGAGVVAASDSILQGFNKVVGNLAAKQATGNYVTSLTGDVTASGPGAAASTLATVNSNVGSFTPAAITVNGKGLVTAASSVSTTGTGSVVLNNAPTITGTAAFVTVSAVSATSYGYHMEPSFYDNGDVSSTMTVDWTRATLQQAKATTNLTVSLSNGAIQPGAPLELDIKTGTGGYTVAWPALVKWPGDLAPVFTTTAGKMDRFTFAWNGVNWLGSFAQSYSPTYVPPAGFNPTQIANLKLWTDAQVADSIVKDGSNNVSQWIDLSSNGNNLTATGTGRPVYNATGLNSLPTMVLDGSDDFFSLTTTISTSTLTVFLVVKPNNNGARQGWFGGAAGASDFEAGQFVELTSSSGSADFTQPIASTAAKYWTIQGGLTPSVALFHISGANQTLTGSSGNWTGGLLAITKVGTRDSSWYVDGRISSVIVYDRNLTSGEITQMESYLAGHWGL